MKRAMLLSALAIASASVVPAWADWSDLRGGLDEQSALAAVGAPMIASRSKSRLQSTWTYDRGGYIHFERGRVAFWQAPRGGAAAGEAALAATTQPAGPVSTAGHATAKPAVTRRLVIVR